MSSLESRSLRRMLHAAKRTTRRLVRSLGYDLVPLRYDGEFLELMREVQPYTMTPPQRIFALCEATRYVCASSIPGAIVECGVWRGGSMMAVARTLIRAGDTSRDLYLYDTFEGMPPPSAGDVRHDDVPAADLLSRYDAGVTDSVWAASTLDEVRAAVGSVGYPAEHVHYVAGKVEETIPATVPARISLLRLDTDWYESTRHDLVHLFPLISPGGVLVIDDYGHWKGARRAVDEYVAERGIRLLLTPVDQSARVAVVQS